MERKCPACGRQIRRRDVRAADFPCPGCGEILRLREPSHRESVIVAFATFVLAFVAAFQVGAGWMPVWILGLLLWFTMVGAFGLLKGYFLPPGITRAVAPPSEPVGNVLHIGSPGDSRKSER